VYASNKWSIHSSLLRNILILEETIDKKAVDITKKNKVVKNEELKRIGQKKQILVFVIDEVIAVVSFMLKKVKPVWSIFSLAD